MGWYVVETELKAETLAQDSIKDLGLETHLPVMRRITRSHHRFSNPYLPIFPRYIFVQFDLSEDKFVWPAIARQRGVRKLLGVTETNRVPVPIREADFTRLQELAAELCQENSLTNQKPKPLAPETMVRILWEPFYGATGKIEIDNGIRADVLLAAAGLVRKLSDIPRELIEAL